MKIIIIGPVYPYRGGIAHFATSLSRELKAAGHQVQTISFKRQYPAWLYPGQSDKDPSAVHEQVDALYTLDPFYFWTWAQATRQVIGFSPDLVIFQWWTTFWSPAFGLISTALLRHGIPVVFCIHNVIPHEKRLPDVLLTRFTLSKGRTFITLSPKESARLEQLLPGAKIFSARLPVPRVEKNNLDRSAARQQLGLPADSAVLLFFGIVRPYKGLHVLLDAFGRLRGKLVPRLMVVGEFWDDPKGYQQQVEQLGLAEQVMFVNRYVANEELPAFFMAADAFAAPYINGTQSAAIKMAMSYGLPILASDQISSDLPVDHYPIHVHQAGDVDGLAESIRAFFEQDQPAARQLPSSSEWSDLLDCIQQVSQAVGRTR